MSCPKPRILIIDENLTGPAEAKKYLENWFDKVDTNGITEYSSLLQSVETSFEAFDLVIATPSFIESRAKNVWLDVLSKLFLAKSCPRIVMVSDSIGFKKSLAGMDDRLFFANTPYRASQLVGSMLF